LHSQEFNIKSSIKSVSRLTTQWVAIIIVVVSILGGSSLSAFAQASPGANYYVSPSGSDSNPGTQSQPWQTIQKAANTMVAGDTVVVQAGNYAAQRVQVTRSGSSSATITYQANGTVIMKGFIVQANYNTIRGFEIANTDYRRSDEKKGSGVYIRGNNNVIENNYIHDNALEGIVIYGPPSEPTASSNNIIRNNQLFHNENAGIEVNGRSNLIEGNEVWGTVQCTPALMAVEDNASDNPNHLSCPNYPSVYGLDADGIRFFGQGHIFRNNSIHDILLGPPGINPAIGDFNDDPHIDCFQTWSNTYNEVAQNIIFEQNYCENLTRGMSAFMLDGGSNNLTIRNNIIKAFTGINTQTGLHHLYLYNNIFINDLSIVDPGSFAILFYNVSYSQVENNIFYNQPNQTIAAIGSTTGQVIDYNMAFNSDGSNAPCIKVGNYICANPPPAHDQWNVDPHFTNPGISDYHLQPDSPAIDAGLAVPVTNDYDGNPRPFGWGFDIGALEYSGATSPFADVPFSYSTTLGGVEYLLYPYIHALYEGGYTAGCNTNPPMYCPNQIMSRAESAVFMLRADFGSAYAPPVAPWGTFTDNWSLGPWAEKWAEGMWDAGMTAGCQTNPLKFCPWDQFTRVQATVFGLRIKFGLSYTPPPASGTLLADMIDTGNWGTKWAEQAYLEGLLPACGTQNGKPLFCPNDLVTRAWAAYMIVKAKGLLP
jgi:hypothetical protein